MTVEIYPKRLIIDGQAGETLTATALLVNAGGASATINSLAIVGGNAVFSLTAPPTLPLSLTAGNSQALTVAVDLVATKGEVQNPVSKIVAVDSLGNVTETEVSVNRVDEFGYRFIVGATEPTNPSEGMIWESNAASPSSLWRYENGLWVGLTMSGANANKFVVQKRITVDTQTVITAIASSNPAAPNVAPSAVGGAASTGSFTSAQVYSFAFVRRKRLPSGVWAYSPLGPVVSNYVTNNNSNVTVSATTLTIVSGTEIGLSLAVAGTGGVALGLISASFIPSAANYSYIVGGPSLADISLDYTNFTPAKYNPINADLRQPKWFEIGSITGAATIDGIKLVDATANILADILADNYACRILTSIGAMNTGATDGVAGAFFVKELAPASFGDAYIAQYDSQIFTGTATNVKLGTLIAIEKNDANLDINAMVTYAHIKFPKQSN